MPEVAAAISPPNTAIPMAAKKTVSKPKAHAPAPTFSKDKAPEAAALFLQAWATGNVLWIKRGKDGDHPGEWAPPGGTIEKNEPPMVAALREMREETQFINETGEQPDHMATFNTGDVEIAIYKLMVNNEFIPTLNNESDGYAWAPLDDPPQPVHSGLKNKGIIGDKAGFKEEEHPREEDGKFTAGQGSVGGGEFKDEEEFSDKETEELSNLFLTEAAKKEKPDWLKPKPHSEEFLRKQKRIATNLKRWQGPKATEDEERAIVGYCSSDYEDINNFLRHGASDPRFEPGSEEVYAHDLKSYLDKASFPEEATVFRGVNGSYADRIASLPKGSIFRDKGFLSTTADPEFISHYEVKLRIRVKKGAKGASVAQYSAFGIEEAEVLFQAGTHFKFLEHAGGYLNVEMLLPDEVPEGKLVHDSKGSFVEEDHPRDEGGKFTSGPGTGIDPGHEEHHARLSKEAQKFHEGMGKVAQKHGYKQVGMSSDPAQEHKIWKHPETSERLHFYPHHDLGKNVWSHIDAPIPEKHLGRGGPEEVDSYLAEKKKQGLDEFREEEHPRDEGGKFTAGAGSSGGSIESGTQTFTAESELPEELNGVKFTNFFEPGDWNSVEGINHDLQEKPLKGKPGSEYEFQGQIYRIPDKKPASGVFITEPDGRIWVVKPKNEFGGYKNTFPKGKVDEGLSPQANAIKEAWEESGLHVKITGIVGDFEGDTSISRIYKAERIGGTPLDHGWESEGVVLAKPEDLSELLNRSRDRKIAEATGLKLAKHSSELKDWIPKPDPAALKALYGQGEKEKKPEGFVGKTFGPYDPSKKPKESSKGEALSKPAPSEKPAEKPSPGAGGGTNKPLDMDSLHKIGKQLGSNPGGRYKDVSGNEFYIKKLKSPDHVKNEMLAGALFKLAGAGTLDYVPVQQPEFLATRWQKMEKNNVKDFSPEERKELQEDFAIHAWTANWDAAGLDYDNQSIKDGKVISNDLGGALSYRAQGAPKGDKFGNTVGEWTTLRDKGMNPQNGSVFGSMTQEQLKASAKRVTDIPDAAIRKAVKDNGLGDDLANKLIARKKDIAKKVGLQAADGRGSFIGDAGFKESDHPRGQPENAGQFVKGGGSSSGEAGLTQWQKDKLASITDPAKRESWRKTFIAKNRGTTSSTPSISSPNKPTISAGQTNFKSQSAVTIHGEGKLKDRIKAAISSIPQGHWIKLGSVYFVNEPIIVDEAGRQMAGAAAGGRIAIADTISGHKHYDPQGTLLHEVGHIVGHLKDSSGKEFSKAAAFGIRNDAAKMTDKERDIARYWFQNDSELFAEIYQLAFTKTKKGGFGLSHKRAEEIFSNSINAMRNLKI